MRAAGSTTARPLVVLGRLADLVLIVLILIGLSSVVLGRILPALGHPVFVVGGPSMAPTIPVGAAIVDEIVPPAALAVGDVVSLQSGPDRAIFTHRITRLVDRDGEIWIETKGDANASKDPSITPASGVIGRVAVVIPVAGYALALQSTPPGVVLILSTGTLLIVFGWWIDDMIAARRRAARWASLSEPAWAPAPVTLPDVPADPALALLVARPDGAIPLGAVLADMAAAPPTPPTRSVRYDRGASPRRPTRPPITAADARRRRSGRGPHPRPRHQGA
jgi:signal peptidase